MKPRFLIHPGYPKTGTTSLQANVFARHGQLNYISNHSAPGDTFRDAAETVEFHAKMRDFRPSDIARINTLWHEHMVTAVDQSRINVISDEAFLSNVGPPDLIARHLFQLVGPAQVLLVVRDQADVLRSMYDMFPWLCGDAQRRFLPFPEWIEKTLDRADSNVAGTLFYRRITDLYREIYGAGEVTVISYERLFGDRAAQAQLCARLEIETSEFSTLIAQKPVNTSAEHGTKKLVRRVLGPIKGSSFLTPGQIQVVRRLLARVVPQKRTRVSAADRARIDAFYQGQRIEDLAALGAEGLIL